MPSFMLPFTLVIVIALAFLILRMSEHSTLRGDAAIALLSTTALAVENDGSVTIFYTNDVHSSITKDITYSMVAALKDSGEQPRVERAGVQRLGHIAHEGGASGIFHTDTELQNGGVHQHQRVDGGAVVGLERLGGVVVPAKLIEADEVPVAGAVGQVGRLVRLSEIDAAGQVLPVGQIVRVQTPDRKGDALIVRRADGEQEVGDAVHALLGVPRDAVGVALEHRLHHAAIHQNVVVVVAIDVRPGDVTGFHRGGEDIQKFAQLIDGGVGLFVPKVAAQEHKIGVLLLDDGVHRGEGSRVVVDGLVEIGKTADLEAAKGIELEFFLGGEVTVEHRTPRVWGFFGV